MKKLITIWILLFLSINNVLAKECNINTQNYDVPCMVVSTWKPGVCSVFNVTIYNSTGNVIEVNTLDTFGDTELCNFTFVFNNTGSYYYNTSFNDSGNINVGDNEMVISNAIESYQPIIIFFVMFGIGLFMMAYSINRSKESDLGIAVVLSGISGTMFVILSFILFKGFSIFENSAFNNGMAIMSLMLGMYVIYMSQSFRTMVYKERKRKMEESLWEI